MDPLDLLEREILGKLSMLAEGRASQYDRPNLHRSAPSSMEPPGTFNPHASLAVYHERRFLECQDRGMSVRLTAIAQANLDYETTVHRTPAYNSPDSEQNAQERDDAILTRWIGYRPEWPAVFCDCSESYIRKLRRKHHRNPMDGELTMELVA